MRVIRTKQIALKSNPNLSYLCHISKNFINDGKWICLNDLNAQLNKGVSENYTLLPSQTANHIL